MGLLKDRIDHVEHVLASMNAPPPLREAMRDGFYLGAKAFVDAMYRSSELEEPEATMLVIGCREDIRAYQIQAAEYALGILERKTRPAPAEAGDGE